MPACRCRATNDLPTLSFGKGFVFSEALSVPRHSPAPHARLLTAELVSDGRMTGGYLRTSAARADDECGCFTWFSLLSPQSHLAEQLPAISWTAGMWRTQPCGLPKDSVLFVRSDRARALEAASCYDRPGEPVGTRKTGWGTVTCLSRRTGWGQSPACRAPWVSVPGRCGQRVP